MAGKWAMAKAFGRASHGVNSKENRIVDAARKSYEKDLAASRKNPDAADRAEAFHRGSEEKWLDGRSIVLDKDGRPTTRLEDGPVADARNDVRMDENLQRDFDKALDEAAENHGFKGDLHDVNREDAVQRSREEIIKALQQNTDRDATDVLRDFGYIFEE